MRPPPPPGRDAAQMVNLLVLGARTDGRGKGASPTMSAPVAIASTQSRGGAAETDSIVSPRSESPAVSPWLAFVHGASLCADPDASTGRRCRAPTRCRCSRGLAAVRASSVSGCSAARPRTADVASALLEGAVPLPGATTRPGSKLSAILGEKVQEMPQEEGLVFMRDKDSDVVLIRGGERCCGLCVVLTLEQTGRVEALIDKLIMDKGEGKAYEDSFLITYRSFIQPPDLFEVA